MPIESVLLLAVVAHVVALMEWGTWQSRKLPMRSFAAMSEQRRDPSWIVNWPDDVVLPWGGLGSAPVQKSLEIADRDPRLAWIAHRCIGARSPAEANQHVRDRHWPDELVVEAAEDGCVCGDGSLSVGRDRVALAYVSFNRMVLDVESAGPGCIVVNVPFTTAARTYWRATVNLHDSPLRRANGLMHAIPVRAGASRVELRYWSWPAFLGVLLSAATAAALLMYVAGALPGPPWITIARLAAVLVMAALVYGWQQRVYGGQGWGTMYVWTSPVGLGPPASVGARSNDRATRPWPSESPHGH